MYPEMNLYDSMPKEIRDIMKFNNLEARHLAMLETIDAFNYDTILGILRLHYRKTE